MARLEMPRAFPALYPTAGAFAIRLVGNHTEEAKSVQVYNVNAHGIASLHMFGQLLFNVTTAQVVPLKWDVHGHDFPTVTMEAIYSNDHGLSATLNTPMIDTMNTQLAHFYE
jgi:hypothetical protein